MANYNETLNQLTTEITAFGSWDEFAKSMQAGYVPSLYPHAGRSRAQKLWNAKTVYLAELLEAHGFKVHRGTN